MHRLIVLLTTGTVLLHSQTLYAQQPPDLGKQAQVIFATHCYRCHGENGSSDGGMNFILDFSKLVGTNVIAGNPEKSSVYKQINPNLIGNMPQDTLTKPTAAEIETIKQWILAGAPIPKEEIATPRAFFSLGEEIQALDAFLLKTEKQNWPYYRFFTLRTLHNMPSQKVRDSTLDQYRAGLSKLLNSLSWKNEIIVPEKVDDKGVVVAVDIRKLDWADGNGKNLWREILSLYPYGMANNRYPEDRELNNRWQSIADMTGTDVAVIRTDWFIAQASRPPLYHTLLQLPDQLADLERRLPVGNREYLDLQKNIVEGKGKIVRAGFNNSGVSERNNRLIERHATSYGAFWISYDFKVSAGTGNLFVFPLGPQFKENPFDRHSFKHDGGEIIFNLPNGLQAYMLINAKGKRIDEGPVEIVSDGKRISGTTAIVNGVSCMACHKHGMYRKTDQIRASHILSGKAGDRVKEIYPTAEEMDKWYAVDEKRFLDAVTVAVKPYLFTGKNAEKTIKDFPEPITPIAKWYIAEELNLADAARELGIDKPEKLSALIEGNEELQRLGLMPLTRKGTIKREVWESREFLFSPFQKAAQKLKLGEPATNR